MMLSVDRDSKMQAILGNYFSLVGFGQEEFRVHFGLEGRGFFTLRQEGSRFPLETVDGMFGAYLEARYGSWQFQTRYTHVSAHIADGLSVPASPFSRESFSFRMGYAPNNHFHLYAGFSDVVNSFPTVAPLMVQTGGSYFLPIPFWLTAFAAWDLQWREEWQKTGVSVQLGFALSNRENRYRSFRVFYGFYTGGDVRGQFFGQQVTTHSIGLEWQI